MSYEVIPESMFSAKMQNPIRAIVDKLKIPKGTDDKKMIPLSIGDPTTFGNLKTPDFFVKEIQKAVQVYTNHGYNHSAGVPVAREAVAKKQSKLCNKEISSDDVIITSGCSGAIEIAIKALANEGENILIPRPGFVLYQTAAKCYGVNVKSYGLVPEQNWETDLKEMEAQIDIRTRAIVVNNPSNPCGSVFSKQHLLDILALAEKYKLVVIADEIYGNLVFEGHKFIPMGSLTKTVPIIEVGGIAKEYLVPGFRVGWLIIHDVPGRIEGTTAFQELRYGIMKLTQLIIGANTLIQFALPMLLNPPSGSQEEKELIEFQTQTLSILEKNAKYVASRFDKIDGLCCIHPQGAMYVMVGIETDKIKMNDVEFSQKLLDDELVFVLPGSCFGLENYFRIVFCAPEEILGQACDRIESFCKKIINN